MTEKSPNGPDGIQTPPGKGLSTPILLDPLAERKDIAMLSNIIKRNRWPIPDEVKPALIARLCDIAERTSVDIMTKEGLVALKGPADITAVAAIRVIAMLEGQNQKDEHKLAEAESAKPSGDTYNVGCVGQIALGQEPLTPEDAKRQVQEVLARVKARIGGTASPAGTNNDIIAAPLPAKPFPAMPGGLADL